QRRLAAPRLVHERLHIDEDFARLRAHVAGMQAAVANDAGGAGDQQPTLALQTDDAAAGEGRAARAVVGRVVVGGDLARVFDSERRLAPGEEGDLQRPARAAQRAGSRGLAAGRASAVGEGLVAADVELAIALQAVAHA